MIFCNDCYCISEIIANPHLIISSSFGNIVNQLSSENLAYFQHCIEQEKAEQIVIVGHLHCQVLEYLLKDNADETFWQEARIYMKKLVDEVHQANLKFSEKDRYLVHHHIAKQVKKLIHMPFFHKKLQKNEIIVKGIVIDDCPPYAVEETNVDIFENLYFKLN